MSIPRYDTRFVARTSSAAAVAQRLDPPGALVTVLGQGGLGKTRLATELCWRHARTSGGQGAVAFCDLSACASAEDVLGVIAASARVPVGFAPGARTEDRVVRWLQHGGPALLVLDNAETAVEAVAQVAGRLRAAVPDVKLLVTSRVALDVAGEAVFELPPLSPDAAGDLFRDRAGSTESDERLDGVLRQLGGLPLAVELAAQRLDVLTLKQLEDRLAKPLPVLKTPEGQGRHAALERVIADCWEALPAWSRSVMSQLRAFDGDFSLEGAEAVVRIDAEHGASPMDAIHLLLRRSLIRRVDPEHSSPRFQLVAFVREFLADRELEALDEAKLRHAAFYGREGIANYLSITRVGGPEARRWQQIEMGNLRALMRRGLRDARIAPEHTIMAALMCERQDRAHLDDAALQARFEALSRLAAGDGLGAWRARVLVVRSTQLVHRGRTTESRELTREAVQLAAEAEDPALLARCLGNLGDREDRLGNSVLGYEYFERGLAVAQEHGALVAEASNLAALAASDLEHPERVPRGIARFERSAEIAEGCGNEVLAAWAHHHLGQAYFAAGDLDSAAGAFDRASACARRGWADFYVGLALLGSAQLRQLGGDPVGAADVYRDALEAALSGGDRDDAAKIRLHLGVTWLHAGDLDAAEQHVRGAVDLLATGDDVWATHRCAGRAILAAIASLRGDDDVAAAELGLARAEAGAMNDDAYAGTVHFAEAVAQLTAATRAARANDHSAATEAAEAAARSRASIDAERLVLNRLLLAVLDDLGERLARDLDAWVFDPEGRWFRPPGKERVELAKSQSATRIVAALVACRTRDEPATLSVEELVAAGWPGQRVLASAGRNRVYTAVSSLRKAGLHTLERDGGGYRLDPTVPVRVEG